MTMNGTTFGTSSLPPVSLDLQEQDANTDEETTFGTLWKLMTTVKHD